MGDVPERWVPILPIIWPAGSIGGHLSGVAIEAFRAERLGCEQARLWGCLDNRRIKASQLYLREKFGWCCAL